MEFVSRIYNLTNNFPQGEQYGLVSQLRRAATSIPLNIAEGSGARSDAEFKRFLTIASRSNYELMCGLELSHLLSYCSMEIKDDLLKESDEISAMLEGLRRKLKTDI